MQFFLRRGGGCTHSGHHKTLSPTLSLMWESNINSFEQCTLPRNYPPPPPPPPPRQLKVFYQLGLHWSAQLISKGVVSLLCPKTTCTCIFKFWLLCIPIIYKILTCEQHLGHLCFFCQESDLETVQLQVFSNMIFSRLSRCEWAKVADQSLIRVLSGYHI